MSVLNLMKLIPEFTMVTTWLGNQKTVQSLGTSFLNSYKSFSLVSKASKNASFLSLSSVHTTSFSNCIAVRVPLSNPAVFKLSRKKCMFVLMESLPLKRKTHAKSCASHCCKPEIVREFDRDFRPFLKIFFRGGFSRKCFIFSEQIGNSRYFHDSFLQNYLTFILYYFVAGKTEGNQRSSADAPTMNQVC